ncbi:MAG: hypothetical protein U1E97_04480 [Alphaproteobacteria bacterium]
MFTDIDLGSVASSAFFDVNNTLPSLGLVGLGVTPWRKATSFILLMGV